MTTEKAVMPERIKLDYYALGKLDKIPEMRTFNTNRGISDTAGDLLHRNKLSLNSNNLEPLRNSFKNYNTLESVKKDTNNYLNPLNIFNKQDKYSVPPDMTNIGTYKLAKEKYFARYIYI